MTELHLVSTAFMVGMIVFVQVVHYPLMGGVEPDSYVAYQRSHMVRTGWVVIPAMLAEMGSALWLAAAPPGPELGAVAWAGVALLAVIWMSTALLQAPAHERLSAGFDRGTHRRLVRTNWIRTVAWIARLPIALALAA